VWALRKMYRSTFIAIAYTLSSRNHRILYLRKKEMNKWAME
jgi:hypothetical protein